MSERAFHYPNWTPGATADTPTTLTSAQYMAINGATTTQYTKIKEVFVSGLAGASGAMIMQLGRLATLGATVSLSAGASDGFTDPQASALASPAVSYTAATTPPARSSTSTDPKLEFNFNAFGGIIRWRADVGNGQFWGILGSATTLGGAVFSQFTGGTSNAVSAHIIYETL
jgi:hypothetical protein